MVKYRFIDSSFGDLAVLWRERGEVPRVVRILIPLPDHDASERMRDYPGTLPGRQPMVDDLCAQIARFLSGEPVVLPIDLLDPTVCSPFQWKVLMADRSIPRGEVRTYSQLAVEVGSPRGARAVGNALATNPFPIVIPCHRVVRSNGSLGGYRGGVAMKRALLEMEGVRFDERGHILALSLCR